jgi:inner membrane protein
MAGIGLSIIYLFYALLNKAIIEQDVRSNLKDQYINYNRHFTTPAPLQSFLWYIVAGNDSGYYIGFRSILDSKKHIEFQYFPRNTHLLDKVHDHEDLQKLIRFSQQFYTVERWSDTLVFNDLRFGQVIGWQNPRAKFVFHYFILHPDENKLVVQRGRFKDWNWKTFKQLIIRIKGN